MRTHCPTQWTPTRQPHAQAPPGTTAAERGGQWEGCPHQKIPRGPITPELQPREWPEQAPTAWGFPRHLHHLEKQTPRSLGRTPRPKTPTTTKWRDHMGSPTPSTSWTGINPWPLNSSLSMYCPRTNTALRLGRAPWPGLANVLEDRTLSPFPTPRRAVNLPSTSNNDPSSDTDTLINNDVPEQIRIRLDVSDNVDPEDQRTPRELLLLETRGEEDPFNVNGPDFEWPELTPVDREIIGATRVTAWEFWQWDIEDWTTNHHPPGPWESMDLSTLAVEWGERLNAPNATPLVEQLNANAQREIWDPALGRRLSQLWPRTADKQSTLEHALSCIVWQERP